MAYTEAYYAENGFYPTFNNLNSASWRTANMKGLDPEALKDPDGSSASLKTVPTAKFYAYQPTGCSAQGCTGYTFTAQLDTGETYVKQNL